MRYCSGCGTQLPEGAVFCPSCGRNVQNDVRSENKGNYQSNGRKTFDSEYCQSNNYSNYINTDTQNGYERYSLLSILGLVFAFVAPVVGLILSIFASNEAKQVGSEKNQSLSKAGIVLSAVLLGLGIVAFLTILSLSIAGLVSLENLIQALIRL